MRRIRGVYTPAIHVSDVWLSEAFVTKGLFGSFLLAELLVAFILMSLFSFLIFSNVPEVALVDLGFAVFVDG